MWPANIVIEAWFVLERVNSSHVRDLFRLVQDDAQYLGRWLPWVDQIKRPSDTETFIDEAEKGAQSGSAVHYAIRYRGTVVGVVGFAQIDKLENVGALGYWLGEKWQGGGLMTRACGALVQEARLNQNIGTVEIRCGTLNSKSRAIPERLGFDVKCNIPSAEIVRSTSINHVVYARSKPLGSFI